MKETQQNAELNTKAEAADSEKPNLGRTERLIAGKTCIGRIRRARLKDGTLLNDVPVYYGNVVFLKDRSRFHMEPQTYRKMLTIFLSESSRGKHFMIPSREESDEACRMCLREEEPEEPSADSESSGQTAQKPEDLSQTLENPGAQSSEEFSAPDQTQSEDQTSGSDPSAFEERSVAEKGTEADHSDSQTVAGQNVSPMENGGNSEAKTAEDQQEQVASVKIDGESQKETESSEEGMHAYTVDSRILKMFRRMKAMTVIFMFFSAVLLLIIAGVIPNPLLGVLNTNVNVIVLAKDVSKGEEIREADLTSVLMPVDQLEGINAPDTVDASGSLTSGSAVLWSSRSSVIGKYASAELHAGDVLLSSDCVLLRNSTTMMELNVDGKTVYIPASALDPSKAEVKLYAIVTSSDSESRQSSYAVDLGTLKLSGESLEDILNAEGKSVLETIQGN
ncbi:SAF domain-containing protein [Anaerolactibacter massiliensis]|uniref:SAF domain-containing protein n=1 Tax=Anaerolactibacter massiliensis TaxID=2044573 RepID=UPI000CFA0AEA|nr:SAF domain-containing protein [Anaerolactibacter massiliensis]